MVILKNNVNDIYTVFNKRGWHIESDFTRNMFVDVQFKKKLKHMDAFVTYVFLAIENIDTNVMKVSH